MINFFKVGIPEESIFAWHNLSRWLDIEAVMKKNGIDTTANALEERLAGKPSPPTRINNSFIPIVEIGEIVHYIDKDKVERPAMIAQVSSYVRDEGWVYLKVFVYSGPDVSDFAMHSSLKTVRTWHWPEE